MSYTVDLCCVSVTSLDRPELEYGGKILLPQEVLERLSSQLVSFPLLFKLTNESKSKSTYGGVLEFTSSYGIVGAPQWMMRSLELEESGIVRLEMARLPVASYAKFEPQHVDFLDITDPKAVLENNLRNFASLTTSDIIEIKYNDKVYGLRVVETQPGNAVNIMECDIKVDFDPPVGYVEPAIPSTSAQEKKVKISKPSFKAFSGTGQRLDGKELKASQVTEFAEVQDVEVDEQRVGIPDYKYRIGTIEFFREVCSNKTEYEARESAEYRTRESDFQPFRGRGHSVTQDSSDDNSS